MRVLVLGHTGMLGHMVAKVLEAQGHEILTTKYRWPSNEFKENVKNRRKEVVINCIGAIHQRTNDFDVNTTLPIWLDENLTDSVILHPGTDCEIDSDDYGTSKRIASKWIKEKGSRTKIIKTSIIGPELNKSNSLLEWFLSNEDGKEVYGYINHFWNGNTTLTWALEACKIIRNWNSEEVETILRSQPISKYELLSIINEVYCRSIIINEHRTEISVDKCLSGGRLMLPIREQLMSLKIYNYQENNS